MEKYNLKSFMEAYCPELYLRIIGKVQGSEPPIEILGYINEEIDKVGGEKIGERDDIEESLIKAEGLFSGG